MNVLKHIHLARHYLVQCYPWLSQIAYASHVLIIHDENFPLAGIDVYLNIYFNYPKLHLLISETDECNRIPQLAWIWVHEIQHVLRFHHLRCQAIHHLDEERWNLATDLEINDDKWEFLEMPHVFHPPTPEDFKLPAGMIAEQYYKKLPPSRKRNSGFMRDFFFGSSMKELHAKIINKGKGSTKVEDGPKLKGAGPINQSVYAIERLIQNTFIQMQDEKYRGTIPSGLQRWCKFFPKSSRVPWQRILKRRLRKWLTISYMNKIDYTLKRPHRKSSAFEPFLLPSLRAGRKFGTIAIVIDTSGSISRSELEQAFTEIWNILTSCTKDIIVIDCDAEVYHAQKINSARELQNFAHVVQGGGGTDMVKGINYVYTFILPYPDVILVLTDGYTPFPVERGPIPIIWGIYTPRDRMNNKVYVPLPWTEKDVVRIPVS